jgi:hypothetical protein
MTEVKRLVRVFRTPAPKVDDWEAVEDAKAPVVLGAGRGSASGSAKQVQSLPPALFTTPTFSQVLRFQAVDGTVSATNVSALAIAHACGGIATSATNLAPWASSVRAMKIIVYPSAVATASAVTPVTVVWGTQGLTNFIKDSTKDGSLPSGITQTKALVFKPPRNTLAADWISSAAGSSVVFAISCPKGSIVDFHVNCTMSTTIPPFAAYTTTGLTTGDTYWTVLTPTAGAGLVPLGRPSA